MSNEKLNRMEQLLAFCDFDEKQTGRIHIARWAADEIERLRTERDELREQLERVTAERDELRKRARYALDSDGLCFVEGLGWVVRCCDAAGYVARMLAQVAELKREQGEG